MYCPRSSTTLGIAIIAALVCCFGCAMSKTPLALKSPSPVTETNPAHSSTTSAAGTQPSVQLAAHRQPESVEQLPPRKLGDFESPVQPQERSEESLLDLEALAISNNPTLRRMRQEAAAEWAEAGYVSKLPDPTISSMFFVPPMNFEPDRQVAELQLTQMIPWLGRLHAEERRARLEALAAQTQYDAERLRIIGDLRATWYSLYALTKQIETTELDRAQLESLVTTANARVRTGDAQPGDVLLATLELSSLQEQLLSYRQQSAASTAELNRLVGRDASTPVEPPAILDADLPDWNHDMLRQVAFERQPELNAARLQTAATRWGIEVARLRRRPDLSFGVGWVIMDAPGATEPEAGRDSVTLAASASIPLWHRKYDAMTSEASREHYAAHASEDEITVRLDALLLDLWEQARASQQTVELYENTIIPQARQTFEADQASLINNTVTFDRVIRDYRTLLTLELGYHRALGQLATSIARIRQAVGDDLLETPQPQNVRESD
jgi:outer membrane protein TolC